MIDARALVPYDSLFPVLSTLRAAGPVTTSELVDRTGLTRKVVTQRLDELVAAGLAEMGGLSRSTGGRAPREIRFVHGGGQILVAELTARTATAGLTDLAGTILAEVRDDVDPAAGPDESLTMVERLFDELLAGRPVGSPPIHGIGIGVPGPVAHDTGLPLGALAVPEWVGYPVERRLSERYGLPVWVENDANLLAIGELRAGAARGHRDVLFIKFGYGIGGAVISSGELRRGAKGFAGELGHVRVVPDGPDLCWCGLRGCLTQVVGSRALSRQGREAAADGSSPILAAIQAQGREITAREVFTAAAAGDPVSTALLAKAGELLGTVVAILVSALNPSLVLVDASLLTADDPLMTALQQTVAERALPGASQDLRFAISSLGNSAALVGAGYLVVDELFSPDLLRLWAPHGTPAGAPELLTR